MQRPESRLAGALYDLFAVMGWILGSLRQTFRPRYVKYLEAEVAQLKSENRALWMSIWGQQGWGKPDLPREETAGPAARPNGKPHAPVGRRSWPQIQRALEAEEHKKFDDALTEQRKVRAEQAKIAADLRARQENKPVAGASQEPAVEQEDAA